MTDTDLYSLEIGYAYEPNITHVNAVIKDKVEQTIALELDSAGDIVWNACAPYFPDLPDFDTLTGSYREVSNAANSMMEVQGRNPAFIAYPAPIAKLAA